MTYEKMKWYPLDGDAITHLNNRFASADIAFIAKDVFIGKRHFPYNTDIYVGWVEYSGPKGTKVARWPHDFLPTHFMILSLPE